MDAKKAKKSVGSGVPRLVFLIACACILFLFMSNNVEHFDSLRASVTAELKELTNSNIRKIDQVMHPTPSVLTPVAVPTVPTVTKQNPATMSQQSENAYVTLISGIDSKFRYRGFLYNALIMKKALKLLGSTADFIALIGYSESDTTPFETDMELLRTHGINTFTLPRLLDAQHALGFAEMALLKITPFSFTQYKKIQFLDGDVMPTRNMDCFFELDKNTFTVGAVSPLNSGWYLGIPSQQAFEYMREKAIWRLGRDWDEIQGWAEKMPQGLEYRGGKPCEKWLFNGADMDQGLFTHYFIINFGNAILIDTQLKKARVFAHGLRNEKGEIVRMDDALQCCSGVIPTSHFVHFTGRSKPWLQPDLATVQPTGRNNDLITWKNHLDSLKLAVNSSTISALKLVPPLGYFNANFPKGGFK